MLITKHPTHHAVAFACLLAVSVLVLPTSALGVAREDVLSRGEVWIAKHVPYSQSRYAGVDGGLIPAGIASPSRFGYRTDCSGFASMSLAIETADGLPISLDTATLPYRCSKIAKADLKPGDLILRPKNLVIDGKTVPYGHAVVFVRWVDSTKKSYIGYHQSGSSKGAVAATITYPFWGEPGFSPYRYDRIQDLKLRRSRLWFGPLGSASLPGSTTNTSQSETQPAAPVTPDTPVTP